MVIQQFVSRTLILIETLDLDPTMIPVYNSSVPYTKKIVHTATYDSLHFHQLWRLVKMQFDREIHTALCKRFFNQRWDLQTKVNSGIKAPPTLYKKSPWGPSHNVVPSSATNFTNEKPNSFFIFSPAENPAIIQHFTTSPRQYVSIAVSYTYSGISHVIFIFCDLTVAQNMKIPQESYCWLYTEEIRCSLFWEALQCPVTSLRYLFFLIIVLLCGSAYYTFNGQWFFGNTFW